MKKILSVLVAVLLVSLACVPAFAADTVTINPSATEAAVGDEITISVDVEAGLTGADIVLKYDADYLEYVADSAADGGLFATAEINDGVDGEIHFAGTSTDAAAAGTAFTAKFKVKKANAQVSADANEILDDTGADIAPGMTIASVTIGEKAGGETTTSANGGEATTSANGGNGGNGGSNGGNGGSNGGSKGGSNNPKTGNTPVIGAAAVVLAASAAVLVAMKKKNED